MSIKTVSVSLAAATVLSAGAITTPAPVHASTLSGTLNLQGTATVPDYVTPPLPGTGLQTGLNETQSVVFNTPTSTAGSSGFFTGFLPAGVTINPLALTLYAQQRSIANPAIINRFFRNSGLSPFISFGTRTLNGVTNTLSFILDTSDDYIGSKTGSGTSLSIQQGGVLTGRFVFGTETLATGSLSANRSGNLAANGLYNITLTAQPIPTPALLPGLLGFGIAALRKRRSEVTVETEV